MQWHGQIISLASHCDFLGREAVISCYVMTSCRHFLQNLHHQNKSLGEVWKSQYQWWGLVLPYSAFGAVTFKLLTEFYVLACQSKYNRNTTSKVSIAGTLNCDRMMSLVFAYLQMSWVELTLVCLLFRQFKLVKNRLPESWVRSGNAMEKWAKN